MTEFLALIAFLVIWCGCILALLISSHREEKRVKARDKDWR